MDKTDADKALDRISKLNALAVEANDILDKITIDDTDAHAALDESVAEMKKLVDEMKERKGRIQGDG